MKPYIGIVHQDVGSAYGITFPDAPGCFAASDLLDDLFVDAAHALAHWPDTAAAQHIAVPPTRDLSDLKSDAEWVASFADAVLVIAVPPSALDLPAAA